ncbi:hypothetical protein D8674_026513 [Pyrus ussuriensis x Pyrus communis]|uniref:Transmembrane protein n=1 Tax=Pyrus ussuriensis x Pyrus communis TaxID=2448454 RepID=A0A5N5I8B3_9ROSA|nr:hypothetical protein D8674_026513 [Pyrus ussuriensis x Pyrus communis]
MKSLQKSATTSFAGNLFTFVLLSLLIFSFCTVVENGTHLLTSFVDCDPSLKSLISCLDLVGAGNTNHCSPKSSAESPSLISLCYRHRPFLHLTRVGTLDNDFFSGDDDDAHSLFGPNPHFLLLLSLHLQIRAEKFTISDDRASGRDGNEESNGGKEKGGDEEMDDQAIDLQFLINGLELGCRDVATLFFLLKV